MSVTIPFQGSAVNLTSFNKMNIDEHLLIHESAENFISQFQGAGQMPGLEIWQIRKSIPSKIELTSDNISLCSTNSYIVLKTTQKKDSGALDHQLHCWIGLASLELESRTPADVFSYTAILDDILEQKAVQYLQFQFIESPLFLSYFKNIIYLNDDFDCQFKTAEPDNHTPRLLQIVTTVETACAAQVPLSASSLSNSDVFILDGGSQILQFNGTYSNVMERRRATDIVNAVCCEPRRDMEVELTILDGEEVYSCKEFWEFIGEKVKKLPRKTDSEDFEELGQVDFSQPKSLGKISYKNGDLFIDVVKMEERLSVDDVDDQNIWAVSCDECVFIYVGERAGKVEKMCLWNCYDVIPATLDVIAVGHFTFFSKASASDIWEQLFD